MPCGLAQKNTGPPQPWDSAPRATCRNALPGIFTLQAMTPESQCPTLVFCLLASSLHWTTSSLICHFFLSILLPRHILSSTPCLYLSPPFTHALPDPLLRQIQLFHPLGLSLLLGPCLMITYRAENKAKSSTKNIIISQRLVTEELGSVSHLSSQECDAMSTKSGPLLSFGRS